MTSFADAREAAYQFWVDNTPSGLDYWVFDGEDFDEPDEGTVWARFGMQQISGGQQTLGGIGDRKYRRRAIITVQIQTPRGRGLRDADLIADQVVSSFEGAPHGVLDLYDASVRETPPGPEDKFRQTLVTVDCSFYITK